MKKYIYQIVSKRGGGKEVVGYEITTEVPTHYIVYREDVDAIYTYRKSKVDDKIEYGYSTNKELLEKQLNKYLSDEIERYEYKIENLEESVRDDKDLIEKYKITLAILKKQQKESLDKDQ